MGMKNNNALDFFVDKIEQHLIEKAERLSPIEKEYMLTSVYDTKVVDDLKDKHPTFFNHFNSKEWEFKIRDILYERLNEEGKRTDIKAEGQLGTLAKYYPAGELYLEPVLESWRKNIQLVLHNTPPVMLTNSIRLLHQKIMNPPTKLGKILSPIGIGIYYFNKAFRKLLT